MHRFFVPKDSESGEKILFSNEQSTQISRVLRLGSGDAVVVFDGSGYEKTVRLELVDRRSCTGTVIKCHKGNSEPRVKVTLYQALIKPDRFEYTLQKGVEIGITGFSPIISSRTQPFRLSSSRITRWRKIIMESAEQSGRVILPALAEPVSLDKALKTSSGLKLIPWENETQVGIREVLREQDVAAMKEDAEVSIFIGPIGGFSCEEIQAAKNDGVIPVSLGKRVLRSETAGIATAVGVLYESGDMG